MGRTDAALATVPAPQRADGRARLTVDLVENACAPVELFQSGSARMLLPRTRGGGVEAVLTNTAGGMTGGDAFAWTVRVGAGASAIVSTPACEKVYRAEAGAARVDVDLTVRAGGRLDWMPRETILFDRSALSRRIEADVAPDGRLLLAEAVVLGRRAMGETVARAALHDRWRVRRGGALLFADDLRLEGPVADIVARRAVLAGAGAFATLLLVSPDAGAALDPVRAAVGDAGGASAFDGRLVVRLVAPDGLALRQVLLPTIAALRGGATSPRIWAF